MKAMMNPALEEAIQAYLSGFEVEAKRRCGVRVEESMLDTLTKLEQVTEGVSLHGRHVDQWANYFTQQLGTPSALAETYPEIELPKPWIPGNAPGWRLCCVTCGRSAPAAKVGIIRIGAKSIHKYVLGRCSCCGGLRWLSLVQDLDRANLTPLIMELRSADDVRKRIYKPKQVIALILLIVGTLLFIAFTATVVMNLPNR